MNSKKLDELVFRLSAEFIPARSLETIHEILKEVGYVLGESYSLPDGIYLNNSSKRLLKVKMNYYSYDGENFAPITPLHKDIILNENWIKVEGLVNIFSDPLSKIRHEDIFDMYGEVKQEFRDLVRNDLVKDI